MAGPPQVSYRHIVRFCDRLEEIDLTNRLETRRLQDELRETRHSIILSYEQNHDPENHTLNRRRKNLTIELIDTITDWIISKDILYSPTTTESLSEATTSTESNSTGSR